MNLRADLPFALDHPRAWRTYLGGRLLDRLHGVESAVDGHFPEEWILSVVSARNPGREAFPDEGLSRTVGGKGPTLKACLESNPAAFLGRIHAAQYGAHPGVLIKLIDAAERLTIQVHPDRAAAKRFFGTPFGKTECWHILGGRNLGSEKPCVYLGFQEGIDAATWRQLFEKQDTEGMLSCLHRFEVSPGDTVLVEGGVPHAIGAGCFLTEIQEPTDLTLRVERVTPGGFCIADESCHQGLGFDRMFNCFHYEGLSRAEVRRRWFIPPRTEEATGRAEAVCLLNYSQTPYFSMRRIRISGVWTTQANRFSGLYVLRGQGTLRCTAGEIPLHAPQQIFVPAGTGQMTLAASEPLTVLQFLGPKTVEDNSAMGKEEQP